MQLTEEKRAKAIKVLMIGASVTYALVLLWALWLKLADADALLLNFSNLTKLTPKERFFSDQFLYLGDVHYGQQLLEVVLNCIVFLPFGLAFNFITKGKKVWAHIILCFLFSLMIESVQFFTLIGGFSFVDLATNIVGYLIGLGLYHLIFKRIADKYILVLTGVAGIVLIGSLIYAIVSTALISDTLAHIFNSLKTVDIV